mgnify:CR=1 FL=1
MFTKDDIKTRKETLLVNFSNEENAKEIITLLNGKKSAFRDVVILNSASALLATGNAANLEEAATKAIESIDKGKALEKLNMLINMTND